MYRDLAEAIEDAKDKGFSNLFEVQENGLTTKGIEQEFSIDQLNIVSSFHFDQGTSAGDDRSLFLIETASGVKGYLSTGYTTYKNRQKAEFLDKLINN
ncbi:MAG: hypothetical protein U5K69_00935 [Balneolaceae bacterium]|nr:hypothetical protein [Balneolaceae bacterium]